MNKSLILTLLRIVGFGSIITAICVIVYLNSSSSPAGLPDQLPKDMPMIARLVPPLIFVAISSGMAAYFIGRSDVEN